MFDVINQCAHGYIAIPVMLAFKRRGVFQLLAAQDGATAADLVRATGARDGHLHVALNLLEALGWIERDGERYRAGADLDADSIPDDIGALYAQAPGHLLQGDSTWLARCAGGWHGASSPMRALLDGAVLLPLLMALPDGGDGHELAAPVQQLLQQKGWDGQASPADRHTLALAMAHAPLLAGMEERIFGTAASLPGIGWTPCMTDPEVAAAVARLCALASTIFDREPVAAQPRYLLGAGHASVLRALYDHIEANTARGRVLAQFPLALIAMEGDGSDGLAGTPHLLVTGDSSDPASLAATLAGHGIALDSVLPVLDLLGKARAYREAPGAGVDGAIATSVAAVDGDGASVTAARATASLLQFWRAWGALAGGHGVLVASLHGLGPARARRHPGARGAILADALRAFGGQHLAEADVALLAAGRCGLFPKAGTLALDAGPYKRTSVMHLEQRAYCIRPGRLADLDALVEIDNGCWAEAMRIAPAEFARRVSEHPDEQFVLEKDGAAIGVLYTQPIGALDDVHRSHWRDIVRVRQAGGAVRQFISLNILPSKRDSALGDQLIDFAIDCTRASSQYERIGAVSRSSGYPAHRARMALSDYIGLRRPGGQLADPMLSFHESHGASIVGLVPNFREEDVDNDGCGVLVHYDFGAARPVAKPAAPQVALQPAEVQATVERLLRTALGEDGSARALPRTQPFMELGLGSMQLLHLRSLLSEQFGQPLDSSFLFRHNTVAAVAAALAPAPAAPAPAEDCAAPSPSGQADGDGERGGAIAIVGVAARLPGGGPEGFWQLLRDGVDAVRPVPANRWWWPAAAPEARRFEAAGYLDDVDSFDAPFFRISRAEAELVDPQQRLLLELTWELFEDAGYDPHSQRASATGVWIGACHFDYRDMAASSDTLSAHTATGTSGAILPNRISYFFDLKGPSQLIDTACSSSLVALHDAAQALRRGDCAQAVVGGVNLICTPSNTRAFARAGMLSPTGRCHTFDRDADGYIRGEGAAMVLLKPLAKALADGDQVYGVLAGSAVNHGGQASSLTAPSPQAQSDVITRAYLDAGMSPRDVSYVEAHGTGTRLGDPIEISALKEAFSGLLGSAAPAPDWVCHIGSVKSNIGHLEGAAGIAGLGKILLALRHKSLPGNLHFKALNPHIDLSGSPFQVVAATRPWEAPAGGRARCASVSSFGFGGVSAHALVREFQDTRVTPAGGRQIVPLSARSDEQLRRACANLLEVLDGAHAPRLEDLAWTLQCGRNAMQARLAIVAGSTQELGAALRAFLAGAGSDSTHFGSAAAVGGDAALLDGDEGSAYVRAVLARGEAGAVARLWASGAAIDWARVRPAGSGRRVSLPTYPFARERYWVPAGTAAQAALAQETMHPLLHRNSSDFDVQRYASTFSGDEFFLADHVLQGQRILPGVAYLEMARAAVAAAAGIESGCGIVLSDTVWLRPIAVGGTPVEVDIELVPGAAGDIVFSVGGTDPDGGPRIVYCQGRATLAAAAAPSPVDLAAMRERCGEHQCTAPDLYARFRAGGFAYGPAQRAVAALWWSGSEALTQLALPACVAGGAQAFGLHPSLLDAAVQGSTAALGLLANGVFALPYAIERVAVLAPLSPSMWAACRRSQGSGAAVEKFDIDLCDDSGRVCVEMRGMSVRSSAPREEKATSLWRRQWRPAALDNAAATPVTDQHLVLLCGMDSIDPAALARASGARCIALNAQGTLAARYQACAEQLWAQLHALAASRPAAPVLVQLVLPADGEGAVFAGLAGMIKSARIEQGQLVGQVVQSSAATGTELAGQLRQCAAARAVMLRCADGQVMEEAWQEAAAPAPAGLPWREQGVYLLTGGLGGLGIMFAREIAARVKGATLVLSGRRALEDAGRAVLAQLETEGVRAVYRQADVASTTQASVLLRSIKRDFGALHGIIHGAGVIEDGLLASRSAPRLDNVFGPKVAGLVNLAQASDSMLDWLVCMSSTSGALGNAGQADYGAANAFMDRYADWRNAQCAAAGQPRAIVSINWPLWEQGGMGVDASVLRLLNSQGLHALPPAQGITAFYQALASDAGQTLVMHGQAQPVRAWMAAGGAAGLIAAAAIAPKEVDNDAAAPAADEGALRDKLRRLLRGMVGRLLKSPPDELDEQRELGRYGLDSISLTELTALVNQRLGVALSPTFFFEHPTLKAVLDRLLADYSGAVAKALGSTPVAAVAQQARSAGRLHATRLVPQPSEASAKAPDAGEAIAIVGMSGRYPQARDLDAFWRNLRDGLDCVTEVPPERWNWRDHYSADRTEEGRHYSKWGGFIEGVDEFDPLFFNISPREARNIDPQERLFLQHAWMAMEDAGYTRAGLQLPRDGDLPGQVGVYAGVMYSEYQLFGAEAGVSGQGLPLFGSFASIANRVSYALNLHGPSMTLDTMCSSSLTAIHVACQDLKLGRTDMAIAGGVNVTIHPQKYLMLSAGQFISSDGHCQSFGEGGDGYIPGEGVGVVVLKRLSEAERDGDTIYGVILGSSLTHGGKVGGYSVPNPQAQSSAIARTMAEARVDARHISYVEAHGTGTKLGDPIEIAALAKAFARYTQQTGYCRIGSAKSNIGHCESAAGIAGLMKVLLQMRHGEIVASLHADTLNPHIDFDKTPFVVNRSLMAWERPVVDGREVDRIAGLSSFGAGGSNAHMIVQEYRPRAPSVPASAAQVVFLLSARTAEQLRQKAQDLLAYVEQQGGALDLAGLAFTLQVGREAMDERLAMLASDGAQLQERLRAFLAGERDGEDTWHGQVRRGAVEMFGDDEDMREAIGKWVARHKFGKLLELWVRGLDLDWNTLYAGGKPARVRLPAYPFARERHWVDTARRGSGLATVLHPLLHANTSDLLGQRYSSWFDGREFFLADHQVRLDGPLAHKVLPAVAYLEMAREAVRLALPEQGSAVLEISHTVWATPLTVHGRIKVSIALQAGADGIDFEIYSEGADGEETVHCHGRAAPAAAASAVVDLDAVAQRVQGRMVTGDAFYAALHEVGLEYGAAHRALQSVATDGGEVLAVLDLPPQAGMDGAYLLHPSLMDGALQACMALAGEPGGAPQLLLPFALESVRIESACPPQVRAWVRHAPGSSAGMLKLDIDLCEEHGKVCVAMRGLTVRPVQAAMPAIAWAAPVWQAAPVEAALPVQKRHVWLLDMPGIDAALMERVLAASCRHLAAGVQGAAARYQVQAAACFAQIQALLQAKLQGRTLVQVVVADRGDEVLLAGLAGLLRTASLENPQLAGQLVLVEAGTSSAALAQQLAPELGTAALVRYRRGRREVQRWQEQPWSGAGWPVAFRDDGVYLISGGMGGLGLLFAREILARTTGAQVVLSGRAALDGERQGQLDALGAAGRVHYRQVDLENPAQVQAMVGGICQALGRLDGIVHSAGQVADNFILKKTVADFAAVLGPKVAGTVHLDLASAGLTLDFMVLFSSVASALGNTGQADYASANGFMDQYAAYRNELAARGQRHGRTVSINWPLWEQGGMGVDDASLAYLRELGMQPLRAAEGLQAFYGALAQDQAQVMVLQGDARKLQRLLAQGAMELQAAAPASAAVAAAAPAAGGALQEQAQDYLRRQLSAVLHLPASRIDVQSPLEAYGMDSVLAMTLVRMLEKDFGSLSKTLLFEYQTLAALADYFGQEHGAVLAAMFARPAFAAQPQAAAPPASAPVLPAPPPRRAGRLRGRDLPATASPRREEPIAIIGMSGRYPQARDLDAFWRNLRDGLDCVTEVPPARWNWREHYSADRSEQGRHYSKWGGFIEGVDEFDPLFFNISPREAHQIDPQERLFLQHSWMAMEDAGYTRAALQLPREGDLPGQVGVYAGVMYSQYQLLGAGTGAGGADLPISSISASIANRVSYALNLHGPSMAIDTMCSSSLTAIHLACQDLRHGRTDMALAGGVNVTIHPQKYQTLSAGQFISSDGHCQSFGEGGDGYIPGEGVGVVLLKRLSEAERDGDTIHGVILGSSLNHGGKTNGYTVPNPQAQSGAIARTLADAGVDARHISYVEAHGTGTKLGDPIEIAALAKAFGQHTQEKGYCRIGSAKSNIGHCESAAGIAGLMKVLLQMRHGEIAASLHAATLNPHIDFDQTPFVVNRSLTSWERPTVDGRQVERIAGLSSFGAGGSNAHLIVREHRQHPEHRPQRAATAAQTVFVLSARTAGQLRQKAQDLLTYVEGQGAALDLAGVACTLQVGREAMDERLGILADDAAQLRESLQAYLQDQEGQYLFVGKARRSRDGMGLISQDEDMQQAIGQWIARGKFGKLLELWSQGLEVDWNALYTNGRPQRVSLPAYPFATDRYWVDTEAGTGAVRSGVLHPLLHANTSRLNEQNYTSWFDGRELFMVQRHGAAGLADGGRSLPAAACLEMAREAISLAVEAIPGRVLELAEVVWTPDLVTDGACVLGIGLQDAADGAIEFDIYTMADSGDQQVICQGRGAYADADASPLALTALEQQMDGGWIGRDALYLELRGWGLDYSEGQQALEGLARGEGQALARLRLPAEVEAGAASFILHPILLDAAIQACAMALAPAAMARLAAFAIESLRSVRPCTAQMLAWVRLSPGHDQDSGIVVFDIDLCDSAGNVCVQMTRVQHQWHTLAVAPEAESMAELAQPVPVALKLAALAPAAQARTVALAKPRDVALRDPHAAVASLTQPRTTRGKPQLTLAPADAALHDESGGPVALFDHGAGVFGVTLATADGVNAASAALLEQLMAALARVRSAPGAKVLMLRGTEQVFLRGSADSFNRAASLGLFDALASMPQATIAVMQGDATGLGLLVGALCDFMVGSSQAWYGYTADNDNTVPALPELHLLAERFGRSRALDLACLARQGSGSDFHEAGWTFPVMAPQDVMPFASALAQRLADKPLDALQLLKTHLARNLAPLAAALAPRLPAPVPVLADAGTGEETWSGSWIRAQAAELPDASGTVLLVTVGAAAAASDGAALLAELSALLAHAAGAPHYRALILASELDGFLAVQDREGGAVPDLCRQLLALPMPAIAMLDRGAHGLACFIAQHCDACVLADDAVLALDAAVLQWQDSGPAAMAVAACSRRFGPVLARQFLFERRLLNASELRRHGATLAIAPRGRTMDAALQAARGWARVPADALAWWRQPLSFAALHAAPPMASAAVPDAAPGAVALRSGAVRAIVHPGGVIAVHMEDRGARNMFSEDLVAGMTEVFAHIDATPAYRSVVLTGYDNYFASGGTRENLLAIQAGAVRFTDRPIFELPLRCRLPVVAAMQGHGIGAGWALGMFADLTLFSERSEYFSPYMNYGFTPGAGATRIFGERIGMDLARETMLTGQQYTGRTLRERGMALPVLRQDQVLEAALAMARAIAGLPRGLLIALKDEFAAATRAAMEDTYKRELDMHERTFVGRDDTLARIRSRFAQPDAAAVPATAAPVQAPLAPARDAGADLLEGLRRLLADELQMASADVGEDIEFIDLGLDSVSGVTWVRKINEQFGLAIEATLIYSHPTLRQFAQHLRQQASNVAVPAPQAAPPAPAPVASPRIQPGAAADMLAGLRALLADELQMRPEEIDDAIDFVDLGLDSVSGVTWVRKINERYGTAIEATLIYSHPTLRQLSAHLARELGTLAVPAQPVQPVQQAVPAPVFDSVPAAPAVRPAAPSAVTGVALARRKRQATRPGTAVRGDPIAVVGLAGQFPQAADVDAFWRNIAEGRNCITEVPSGRWDSRIYYREGDAVAGKTNSRWMGALDAYDCFDPLFFNISPTEAESMDPQQRLFLQSSWDAIEHAGYNARALSGSKCGVFVGCGTGDYHQNSAHERLSAQGFTGSASAILAARISYFLNLQGPSLAIDTACSSSLVAIAQACDSLNAGNIDAALAGGVYVMAGPEMHIKTAQAGMLSADGRCFTFDQRANGFVPGEAVATVMLKRLADAERDGDTIHGVIRGWGVNQDGKTNGITAPNPQAQAALQRDVYSRFGIDPGTIGLIEAHGTGTKLGDPIEVQALKQSFGQSGAPGHCALGSVKSNIGHCLTAAGATGFIKLVQALKHRQLPPTIHFEKLNEHINLAGSPFYVNDKLRAWDSPGRQVRRAAISSFGFSGTNAHLVLEEYRAEDLPVRKVQLVAVGEKSIVPLSAKTPEQLRQRVADLLAQLSGARPLPSLAELSYTLQTGRVPMDERVAFMAGSLTELVKHLLSYLQDQRSQPEMYRGQVSANKGQVDLITEDADVKESLLATHLAKRQVAKLAQLWSKGVDLDWNRLYGAVKPLRIALPGYPFARERYWNSASGDPFAHQAAAGGPAFLHPLVHVNVSDFTSQRYSATFSGDEPFLLDHRVRFPDGTVHKVLPGVACLEMARMALADALRGEPGALELCDTVWLRPVMVGAPRQLFISLMPLAQTGLLDQIEFRIHSLEEGEDIVHCQGRAVVHPQLGAASADLEQVAAQCREGVLAGPAIYAAFEAMGLQYGPSHQGIDTLLASADQVLARLRPCDEAGQYVLPPGTLDSALQAMVGLGLEAHGAGGAPLLPFALASLRILAPCSGPMSAWVRRAPGSDARAAATHVDIDLCGADGSVCVQMRGFICRHLHDGAAAKTASSMDGARAEQEDMDFDTEFYGSLIDQIANEEVSIDAAVKLG
ncbi:SDR family NAD(P)-dependent oxidoreductase [Massilia sp. PAMC28688]|uniref:SDR family NAD(P)-dependent oxidoreductase n=1 Tax=Massilia sp. PAMC28688 TaxID=2861283 RepID=UPI001C628115|nr:SDR family NAD(P)-dependent oxidoreductase [Massilia sp. PAMC28688]QYF93475.1 SDR family NAD(P)-dependent oxidoreductase [Massilia sp. PAMC28688]